MKKRTREISKVFHSYHPYDHKVNHIKHLRLGVYCFVCVFLFVRGLNLRSGNMLTGQPRSQGLLLLVTRLVTKKERLRVYRHLLLGDSCRYALLDLRASFWRQSRISNKYFCDSPTRGLSVLANRAYSM